MSQLTKITIAGAVVVLALLAYSPPKDSAEIAAWVQAVGSIAAVGAAVWVVHRSDDEKRHAAWKMSNLYSATLLALCAALRDSAGKAQTEAVRRLAEQLEELIDWGRRVEIHTLPERQVLAFIELRAVAASTLGRAKEIKPSSYDEVKSQQFFEDQRQRVHDISTQGFWIGPGR